MDAAVGPQAADGVQQADHFRAGDAGENLFGSARIAGDLVRLDAGEQDQAVVFQQLGVDANPHVAVKSQQGRVFAVLAETVQLVVQRNHAERCEGVGIVPGVVEYGAARVAVAAEDPGGFLRLRHGAVGSLGNHGVHAVGPSVHGVVDGAEHLGHRGLTG